MLLSTLAFTFRPGPRAGQIDTTNFGRDELENGTFTRGESLITSFKNLENDMVLLGKKKNQPQEKYSKMYKNILDDVLADIQDVARASTYIEKAGHEPVRLSYNLSSRGGKIGGVFIGSQTSVVFRFIVGVELMTHAYPQYFLLLASIANIGKKISLLCYLAARVS
ncbi:protein root UVB sensitive 4 [Tanacetum coccineum]